MGAKLTGDELMLVNFMHQLGGVMLYRYLVNANLDIVLKIFFRWD
jgi:hypothetical protein